MMSKMMKSFHEEVAAAPSMLVANTASRMRKIPSGSLNTGGYTQSLYLYRCLGGILELCGDQIYN